MTGLRVWIAGLWLLSFAAPALARTPPAPAARACCRAPAGTAVEIELTAPVSTKVQKTGDTFPLRLAEPLIVDGRILLPAGTPGIGDVVEASGPGMGGKAAKLVLAARYVERRGRRVALEGLQLSGAGKTQTLASSAVGLTGMVFAPLGFVALAVEGGNVTFPAGLKASARLADDVRLPSLRRATRAEIAAAAAPKDEEATDAGPIAIPPPPAGKGQVVFFRKKTILGTAQWFKVRESGKALGKLTNGAYFIQVTEPGVHTYTATFEPELKDHLTLQVDPGETYYVEGTTTNALVIGAADLSPSDRAAFEKASKGLKPAAGPVDDTPETGPSETGPEGKPAAP